MHASHFFHIICLQIVWRPYASAELQPLIPEYALVEQDVWRACVPLICFHIVEWHQPDRVLRQFGMRQSLPRDAIDLGACHTIQLRGKQQNDWREKHKDFIEVWTDWRNRIAYAPLSSRPIGRSSQYMRWYWSITRRWIHPASGAQGFVVISLMLDSQIICHFCHPSNHANFFDYATQLQLWIFFHAGGFGGSVAFPQH